MKQMIRSVETIGIIDKYLSRQNMVCWGIAAKFILQLEIRNESRTDGAYILFKYIKNLTYLEGMNRNIEKKIYFCL